MMGEGYLCPAIFCCGVIRGREADTANHGALCSIAGIRNAMVSVAGAIDAPNTGGRIRAEPGLVIPVITGKGPAKPVAVEPPVKGGCKTETGASSRIGRF